MPRSSLSQTACASLTLAALVTSGAAVAEKWDMPLAYAASNFHSENAATFAECVTTGTDQAIEIVTHPSGALFGGEDIKRAVQTGQAPIGERLLSSHQNENAVFGFDSIPFLATSFGDSDKLYQAAKPTVETILDEQGLVLLYAVPWPPQGLYFNKPVESVADMDGIKFRSYNNATARLAELTGMQPVSIEAAEISQAFATGVAASMVSSGATGYDRKVWESLSHFYEVDAWLPRNYVFVNKDTWEGLDENIQDIIRTCAGAAEARGTEASIDYTDFTVDALAENGMTVEEPSEKLAEELQEIGRTMTEEWLEEAGEDGQAIIDSYRSK